MLLCWLKLERAHFLGNMAVVCTNHFFQNVHLNTNLPTSWSQTSLGIALICIPGVEVFGLERENFFREASTGLHVTAYWLAKLLDTLLWIPFYSLIFTSLLMAFSPFYIEFYRYWLM